MTHLFIDGRKVASHANVLAQRDLARELSRGGQEIVLRDGRGMGLGSYHNGEYQVPQPPQPLDGLCADAMVEALEYTKGDKARAAELLGVSRTTMYRKAAASA